MRTYATMIWATVAFALGAVVIGWLMFGAARARSISRSESAKSRTELRIKVRVVHPQPGGLPWSVTRPASIHAFQRADLYAKVSGFLQHQVVDIGDRVKRRDLLAEVFAPEIVAGVEKAKADLANTQALVEVSQAQIAEADSDLAESRARLEQTQSELITAAALLKLRELQYNRMARLAKLKAIEQELVDESFEARQAAEAAQVSAEKAVATAEAAVAAATAHLTRAKAELSSAQAQVQVATAVLAQATVLEEYTRIRSPYNGVITARNFHDGDFIRDAAAGGAQPVLAVAETDLMRVIVWVPDQEAPNTHRGNAASLRVDSLEGREFKGFVARTATSLDYNTRTMRTEIDVRNLEGLLTDGMFGSATIELGRRKNAVTIPSTCLAGEAKGERFVYLVRDGRASRGAVQVGREDGMHAEVLAGLKLDDQVIEEHGPGLDEGTLVEIVGSEGHAAAVGVSSALNVREADHAKAD
ncbi:MAG TPA: efflux RND transporter periplasmic adaptor subunit [Pirellulales bacterium]|nr:efflux RND transporter periplasmic adaptor subunit [Pirellulales bacterium]